MKRVNIDLTIAECGTYSKKFTWQTGTPLEAVDITNYTGHMQVRAKLTSDVYLIDIPSRVAVWTPDGLTGIYFDDASEGTYRVYIKDEDTAGICATHKDIDGVYDLFLYSPEGEAVLQMYGVATLVAAVTRDE